MNAKNSTNTMDFQKYAQMLAGEMVPQAKQLTDEIKKQISRAYFKLFFGLAGANWANGKTLGAAWYDALGQIKSMIGAKDKSNPATMYLSQIHAAHTAKWAQVMMTHPNKDDQMEITPDQKKQWLADSNKEIGTAMSVINTQIQAHTPEKSPQKTATTATPTPAQAILNAQQVVQKRIMAFMAMQQRANRNAA